MTDTEMAALLVRMDATFPSHLSEVERKMRVEEWLDSSVARFDWQTVGREAWRQWKDTRDRAPSPHQFSEVCRSVFVRNEADRPDRVIIAPAADASPEERSRVIADIRETRLRVLREMQERHLADVGQAVMDNAPAMPAGEALDG